MTTKSRIEKLENYSSNKIDPRVYMYLDQTYSNDPKIYTPEEIESIEQWKREQAERPITNKALLKLREAYV